MYGSYGILEWVSKSISKLCAVENAAASTLPKRNFCLRFLRYPIDFNIRITTSIDCLCVNCPRQSSTIGIRAYDWLLSSMIFWNFEPFQRYTIYSTFYGNSYSRTTSFAISVHFSSTYITFIVDRKFRRTQQQQMLTVYCELPPNLSSHLYRHRDKRFLSSNRSVFLFSLSLMLYICLKWVQQIPWTFLFVFDWYLWISEGHQSLMKIWIRFPPIFSPRWSEAFFKVNPFIINNGTPNWRPVRMRLTMLTEKSQNLINDWSVIQHCCSRWVSCVRQDQFLEKQMYLFN